MNRSSQYMVRQFNVPSGTEINCRKCGLPLNMDNYLTNMWSHSCFEKDNPKTHIFQFDEKYRLYTLPLSALTVLDDKTRHYILKEAPFQNQSQVQTETRRTSTGRAAINDNNSLDESGFFEGSETNTMPEDPNTSDSQLDFFRKLIMLIRDVHKGIWNHIQVPPEERSKVKILGMWVKIANELGVDYKTLMEIWENLKKEYRKAKKQLDLRSVPSGNSANSLQAALAQEVDFPLFNEMKFLDDVQEPIPTSDSLSNSDTTVQSTIDQVQKITGKPKPRKRSRVEYEGNAFSFEKEVLSLLKENKDPEDERLTAISLTVKSAMKYIPQKFWFRVQGELTTFLNEKIEEYSES